MSRFWQDKQTAGPTAWDVARVWDRVPRYLRAENRSVPAPLGDWTHPVHLLAVHMHLLVDFWRSHYGEGDWCLDPEPDWIYGILSDPETVVLGVFECPGHIDCQLVGTIVCRPLVPRGAHIRVGEATIDGGYIIEGLCVHRAWRGKHLAGWLIAWIDFLMNRQRPYMFLWCREVPTHIKNTNIACQRYAYIRSEDLVGSRQATVLLQALSWSVFQELWSTSAPLWSSEKAVFPTSLRSDPLHVWSGGGLVVAVSRTCRYTRGGENREAIWEVVWRGRLTFHDNQQILMPLGDIEEGKKEEWRGMLEAVAAQLERGVLFVSDVGSWSAPWRVGTSGYQATYMYNFMPPAFWDMSVHFPRVEL